MTTFDTSSAYSFGIWRLDIWSALSSAFSWEDHRTENSYRIVDGFSERQRPFAHSSQLARRSAGQSFLGFVLKGRGFLVVSRLNQPASIPA